MFQQLRANALAASALAVAFTAMSISIVGLPHNSVGSKQIKKAAVHKSDIHQHAVTKSKLGTGVLSPTEGFALSSSGNVIPSGAPEVTYMVRPFTTTTTGRIFGFGRGSFATSCTAGVVRVALYLDDTTPLVNSGAPLPSSMSLSDVNVFGMTANPVPRGSHVISLRADCLSGSSMSTSVGGGTALGAIVLGN